MGMTMSSWSVRRGIGVAAGSAIVERERARERVFERERERGGVERVFKRI